MAHPMDQWLLLRPAFLSLSWQLSQLTLLPTRKWTTAIEPSLPNQLGRPQRWIETLYRMTRTEALMSKTTAACIIIKDRAFRHLRQSPIFAYLSFSPRRSWDRCFRPRSYSSWKPRFVRTTISGITELESTLAIVQTSRAARVQRYRLSLHSSTPVLGY